MCDDRKARMARKRSKESKESRISKARVKAKTREPGASRIESDGSKGLHPQAGRRSPAAFPAAPTAIQNKKTKGDHVKIIALERTSFSLRKAPSIQGSIRGSSPINERGAEGTRPFGKQDQRNAGNQPCLVSPLLSSLTSSNSASTTLSSCLFEAPPPLAPSSLPKISSPACPDCDWR